MKTSFVIVLKEIRNMCEFAKPIIKQE